MLLKPFEACRYDDDSIVVANPANGKQDLFSEREYAIVKFLKQNEEQSLLALLMPNIGIAKKNHIVMCLRVLGKLKRMQIADYFSITGRKPVSDTKTMELSLEKQRIELGNLNALAAAMFGIGEKILAPLGQTGLCALVLALGVAGIILFPFDSVAPAFQAASAPYFTLILVAYLAGSGAFCFRAIVRAAFLRGAKQQVRNPVFALYFPLISLSADCRAVNLLGFKARAQLAALGMISPFALVALFTALAMAHVLNPAFAFTGLAICFAVALILACPLISFDGAEFLQALLFRDELEERVSKNLRGILQRKEKINRELIFALFLALAWMLVWLDCLYTFRGMLSARIAEDLAGPFGGGKLGAIATIAILVLLMLLPVGLMLTHYLRVRALKNRKLLVVQKDKVKDSLTFEERIAALEKIPLFTNLNDQERMALLNEMQLVFFRNGDLLMSQGEFGRDFFILVKGHASARFTDLKGESFLLADLAEGDAFGEIALIDEVPRTASITSDGGCIALVLRKDGFDRFSASLGSPDRVKAMIRLTSFFRRHPLFSKLSPRDQAQLIDSFRFKTITSGEHISDSDEDFHVIYSGSVRVDTAGAGGETDLHSDDCFGYSNPLNARYIAIEGTGLLTVAKNEFNNLIWEKLVEKPELFV